MADAGRVYFVPVASGPDTDDLGLAQVSVAASLAGEGLSVVNRPPCDASFVLSPETAALAPRPRVALVAALEPHAGWRGVAERYAVVDETAGAALIARGVPVERIVVTGWPVPPAVRVAAGVDRAMLRARFDLGAAAGPRGGSGAGGAFGRVAVVDTRGLDDSTLGGLLLSLSLVDDLELLFDAPDEATALLLRDRCPRLGLRARRFAAVPEAPLLYRAADLVVGRPHPALVARARVLGLAILALEGEGAGVLEAEAVVDRGIGRRAASLAAVAANLGILARPEHLDAARTASLASARPDAALACAHLLADVVRRSVAILGEPEPLPREPVFSTGPLEEVGVAPQEQRRAAAERRADRLVEAEAELELDARLAALKARLKPLP